MEQTNLIKDYMKKLYISHHGKLDRLKLLSWFLIVPFLLSCLIWYTDAPDVRTEVYNEELRAWSYEDVRVKYRVTEKEFATRNYFFKVGGYYTVTPTSIPFFYKRDTINHTVHGLYSKQK